MTELYLIRHGQTKGNVLKINQGITNTEIAYLNETGIQQAEKLQKHFDISFADRLIVSPLVRTMQTAEIVNQTTQLPVIQDKRLLEISYGDWDGHQKAELLEAFPQLFSSETKDVLPEYASVAHGEKFSDVEQRVADFTYDIVRKYPHEKIVVVSHGFTIRSFVVNALKAADPLAVLEPENASVSKITIMPDTSQQFLNYYSQDFGGNSTHD